MDAASPGGEATLDIEVVLGVNPATPTEFWSFGGRRNNSYGAVPTLLNQEPFLDYSMYIRKSAHYDF